MKRNANAHWEGSLKEGRGKISTQSGVLDNSQYSFGTRFENGIGTNPEELIGAAHAGCFSMALSMILGQAGYTPDAIDTSADVSLDEVDGGFAIGSIHLKVSASVPGIDQDTFNQCANDAKQNCPVSKVLNAEITMDASLKA